MYRPIEGCQLVSPGSVAIGVCRGDAGAADKVFRFSERIRRLAQDVSSEVVSEKPGRSIRCVWGVGGRIIWIVHPDQLPNGVIHIACGLRAIADAGDVPAVVILICQRHAALDNRLNQVDGAGGTG